MGTLTVSPRARTERILSSSALPPTKEPPLVDQREQALAWIQAAVPVAHHAIAVAVDHDGAREAVEQREVEAVAHAQGGEAADGGHQNADVDEGVIAEQQLPHHRQVAQDRDGHAAHLGGDVFRPA